MQYTGTERERECESGCVDAIQVLGRCILTLAYGKPQPLLYFFTPLIIIVISY